MTALTAHQRGALAALTAHQRGALAERMVYKGARLTAVVHGDGGAHDVANLIDDLDRDELCGLAVVLAAMVDPDAPIGRLLAHVTWDEYLRPIPPVSEGRSCRQLAEARYLTDGEAA